MHPVCYRAEPAVLIDASRRHGRTLTPLRPSCGFGSNETRDDYVPRAALASTLAIGICNRLSRW
jgi:hypothetical protein